MTDLLPEIVDMVIDHLHNDKPSLFACAAVSRRWLPACRFHLFRTITVDDVGDQADLKNLLSFLRSHPQIPPFPRELYVMGHPGCAPPVPLLSLGALITELPNLHTLKLHSIKWSSPSNLAEGRFFTQALRRLHISSAEISGGTRSIFDIIAFSPALEELSLDYVHVPSDEIHHLRDLPEMDLPNRRLKKVSLHASHLMSQFLGYIQITSSAQSLDTVSISSPRSEIERVGDFLHDVGPRLRDLHLRFTFPPPCFHLSEGGFTEFIHSNVPPDLLASDFWAKVGISSCDALESIRIFIPMRPCDTAIHGYSCYWQHILNLLQILPRDIRKMEIGLHVEARKEEVYLRRLTVAPWGQFEQVLSSFKRLEVVRFEDEELFFQDKCRTLSDGLRKYIRRKLRPLHKRGVLHLN